MKGNRFFYLRRENITIATGNTMQVLGCVLDHPLAPIVVLDAVDRHGLEPPPSSRKDQRVVGLEDPLVPPVFLHPQLHEPEPVLTGEHCPNQDEVGGVEVGHKFTRNA